MERRIGIMKIKLNEIEQYKTKFKKLKGQSYKLKDDNIKIYLLGMRDFKANPMLTSDMVGEWDMIVEPVNETRTITLPDASHFPEGVLLRIKNKGTGKLIIESPPGWDLDKEQPKSIKGPVLMTKKNVKSFMKRVFVNPIKDTFIAVMTDKETNRFKKGKWISKPKEYNNSGFIFSEPEIRK